MTKKVAVIGGGIVGCITSFFLIKEGYEVTLVDQNAIGQEASWCHRPGSFVGWGWHSLPFIALELPR